MVEERCGTGWRADDRQGNGAGDGARSPAFFHRRDFLRQNKAEIKYHRPRVDGVMPWGKSVLLRGFQKQIVVPRGVTLHGLLQKRQNIRDDLQFILHDVDRINLGAREFR